MASIKEKNSKIMEQILFRLLETMKLCNQLDLSGLVPLKEREWREKVNFCKNALEFTKNSVEKLNKLICPEDSLYS